MLPQRRRSHAAFSERGVGKFYRIAAVLVISNEKRTCVTRVADNLGGRT
jgi:hypothetical protein